MPALVIEDEVPESEWPQWEVAYIEYFKSQGCDLTNHTLGGESGPGLRGESHPCFGKTGSAHQAFGNKSNTGRKQSPEVIAKKIASMTGKTRSPETKQKQREARLRYLGQKTLAQMWR